MKIFYILIPLLFFNLSVNAQEETDVKNTDWLLEVAFAYGGDDFGEIEFTDGTQQNIKSGNGGTLSAGINQRIPTTNFGVKAVLGYKYSGSMADNANVKKTVIPLDIIPYHAFNRHKVGAGISYHIKPTMDWDTLGPKYEFDNSLGYSFEYTYALDRVQFSGSYTLIDYDHENLAESIHADHFGLKVGLIF